MKKLLKFRFIFFTIFLALLNCREELAMTETQQQKNRITDFFANAKHQSNTNAKMSNSFDYVEFLKQQNLENNFVAEMRDQTGIPIWDKAICMMNKENGTTIEDLDQIIVPLSVNSNTISSLLFVKKNKDGSFSYKNTDNELLKNRVYNNSYSIELRKQQLSTFLLMDNWCFGSNPYSNVPNAIFGENTSSKPFYVSQKTLLSNIMNRMTVCFEIADPPVVVPDDCSCHYDKTVCITFEEGGGGDGEGSGTNGNGHTETGGGGGGTPSSPTTNTGEPCGRNKAWYRINNGCSEEDQDELYNNPCKKIKNTFQKSPAIATETQNLDSQTTDTAEHAISVMNNVTPTSANPVQTIPNTLTGNINFPTNPAHPYILIAHTHSSPSSSTYSVPSWEDLDNISYAIQQNPNFAEIDNFVFVTITADGTRYAIMINDLDAFLNAFYQIQFHAADFDSSLLFNYNTNRADYYYGKYINGVFSPPLIKENSTNTEQDLKYFLQMVNGAGVKVFETNASYNSFTQVTLSNNTIKRTPCN